MSFEWRELTGLTGDQPFFVERVRLAGKDITVEGEFELPPLARLKAEDQVFVAAFVRCHGSIKQMERFFGVSYPTIKNRLNRIAGRLDFVEIEEAPPPDEDVLEALERGDISVDEAVKRLQK